MGIDKGDRILIYLKNSEEYLFSLFAIWRIGAIAIPTNRVFTKAELESREEILYESFAKAINIEARTMIDMATKQIIPAVITYTTELANSITAVRQACPEADVSAHREILIEVSELLAKSKSALTALKELQSHGVTMEEGKAKAVFYDEEIVPAMAALRTPIDKLEMLVDKKYWPMPSYGDLIFEV